MASPAKIAATSTPVAIVKASVKALSVGCPATTFPASTVATAWLPNAPPIVRAIVLMPVATAVWRCGTAATVRWGSAANDSRIQGPSTADPTYISQGSLCAAANIAYEQALNAAP